MVISEWFGLVAAARWARMALCVFLKDSHALYLHASSFTPCAGGVKRDELCGLCVLGYTEAWECVAVS